MGFSGIDPMYPMVWIKWHCKVVKQPYLRLWVIQSLCKMVNR